MMKILSEPIEWKFRNWRNYQVRTVATNSILLYRLAWVKYVCWLFAMRILYGMHLREIHGLNDWDGDGDGDGEAKEYISNGFVWMCVAEHLDESVWHIYVCTVFVECTLTINERRNINWNACTNRSVVMWFSLRHCIRACQYVSV